MTGRCTGGHAGVAVGYDRLVLEALNGFRAFYDRRTRQVPGVRDMASGERFLGTNIDQ